MPIDASIPLRAQAPQFNSPFEAAGQAMQMQGLMQRQQLGAMQMEEHQQNRADRSAVRGAFQSNRGDLVKTAAALESQGLYEPAMKIRGQLAEQAKAAQEQQKLRFEVIEKRMGVQRTLFTVAASNPTDSGISEAAQQMVQIGVMDEEGAKQFFDDITAIENPKERQRQLANYGRKPEDLVSLYTPKFETVDDGQTKTVRDVNPMSNPNALNPVQMKMTPGQVASERSAAASRGLTAAGQAETRRHNRFNEANPTLATVETADGVYQVPNRGGVGRQVMGADGKPLAGKPPTEGQSTAAIYAVRAAEADKIINATAEGGTILPGQIKGAAESIPVIGGALGAVVNTLPSKLGGPSNDQQKIEQAQRNFINAVLRKESGAVISESEFASARKQYFPQLNEGPDIIAQKAQTRADAIAGLTQAGGPAVGRVNDLRPAREPELPDTQHRQSGKVGEPAKKPAAAFTEQRVSKIPMPRDAPIGAEYDDAQGRTFVNDGKSWKQKR